MIELILGYFACYFGATFCIVTIGFYRQKRKESYYIASSSKIDLNELVVLIPFRNEAHRIDVLLTSLNKLTLTPKEFVFINDHSTDNSTELIEQNLENVAYRIIDLPDGLQGKKLALRYGIENSSSTYLLTVDADCAFQTNYFELITTLQSTDMYVLPVMMKARNLVEQLYEIDLILVNAANVGLAGLKRPIMASGANLLFKREVMNEVDSIETHRHISSGDDMYLLRDFREHQKEVRLIANAAYRVETETPQSFKEFIDQRLRWLGKTADLRDGLSNKLTIVQSALTVIFLLLLVYFIKIQEWEMLIYFFSSKVIIDLVLFAPYFLSMKKWAGWLLLPLYELLFPLYVVVIFSLIFIYKPKWKGREIYKHSA